MHAADAAGAVKMGCGGSSEAKEEPSFKEAPKEPAGPSPQELYKTTTTPFLPKGHEVLGALIDLLNEEAGNKIATWLTEIDETRHRRKALEADSESTFAAFRDWVKLVEMTYAREIVSIAQLEKAWDVKCSETEIEQHVAIGEVRPITDDAVEAYRNECPVPLSVSAIPQKMYERAVDAPLPKGDERLEAFIAVLKEDSANMTYGWLKEIDETRSRRKEIEAACGITFASFREWVAIVEAVLAKELASIPNLEKAWAVGKYKKRWSTTSAEEDKV